MTDIIKVVGGGDSEPNLEELGLKPYNSEKFEVEQQSDVIKPQAIAPIIGASAGAILTILEGIAAWLGAIGQDVEKREAFTKTFVEESHKQFPDYNVVIIHTQHSVIHGDGMVKQHYELPMTVGTCGYEIYYSPRGEVFELTNDGDGGYRNWAYYGEYNRNGSTISAIQY